MLRMHLWQSKIRGLLGALSGPHTPAASVSALLADTAHWQNFPGGHGPPKSYGLVTPLVWSKTYLLISLCLSIIFYISFHARDVDVKWDILLNKIKEVERKYVPVSPPHRRKGNMLLDKDTVRLIKQKHRTWTRYIETRDASKFQEYSRLRNQV